MTTGALQTELQPAPPASGTVQQRHGWRYWLLPHPNVLLVSFLYIVVLVSWIEVLTASERSLYSLLYIFNRLGLRGVGILGCVLVLLVIDRIDYWIWGEYPPRSAHIGLFLLRLIVIECTVRLISKPDLGWEISPTAWLALWLYFAVPAMAAVYWGSAAAYWSAALVWCLAVLRFLPFTPLSSSGWFASGTILGELVMYSIQLFMVVAIATIASTERRSRTTAERLLNELQVSHSHLRRITAEALTLTEERNRLARAIHDTLGHFLTMINVQLEKALAFRPVDPGVADQAVRDAKQLGSDALQEVRRSVAALRIARPSIVLPPAPTVRRTTPSRWSRWRWLFPHSFDSVPALWYLGWLYFFLRDTSVVGIDSLPPARRAIITLAVIGLLVVDRLAYRIWGETPRLRISLILLGVRVLLLAGIVIIVNTSHFWYIFFLLPILPHLGFLAAGTRGGLTIGGIVLTGIPLLFFVLGGEQATLVDNLFGFGILSVFLLLVIGALRTALQDRTHRMEVERVLADLEAAHASLKQSSAQALQATEDRNRLARDIHDGLGHYLTVINVQIEKSIAFRSRDAAVADQALADAKRLASDALRDVRSALGVLEPTTTSFSLITGLERLSANVGDRVAVALTINGTEDGFARSSLIVLYRVAQEALTNIQKHAQATQARIALTFGEEHAMLTVEDDGRGFDLGAQPTHTHLHHYGLQGMRERLEVVGGTFSVTAQPGAGTRIDVRMPRLSLAQRTPEHNAEEPSI